jgi:hypothetical protein
MTSMSPGWYDDGHGALRWWDGSAWTEHVANPDPAADADAGVPPELADFAELADAASDDHQGGAFVAATQPERSKLWIVWVVLGVVLLGIVIAAAVLIPLLFLNLATSSTSTPGVAPQTDDERAAVAVVEQYNDAWLDGDCDEYFAVTSENMQLFEQIRDCDGFEESSQYFSDSVEDYSLSITGIEEDGASLVIDTLESYDSYIDENGELVEEPTPFADRWTYVVIPAGDGWVIDEVRS